LVQVHILKTGEIMGLIGALFGGTIGYMLGGPLGAMIGGSIGARSRNNRTSAGNYSTQDVQSTFLIAVISLAAKTAKADGKVTSEEIQTFDKLLQRLGMSISERKMASRIFNNARESSVTTEELTRQIVQVMGNNRDRLKDIISLLMEIAHADGHFHPSEEKLIKEVAGQFGLGEQDYNSCRAMFSSQPTPSSAYEVLGLQSSATVDEVKSAYRKIAKEYHPDIIQSKGLPEEFMVFAKEKLQAVNGAYSTIKKERGF
jgi:DnaJ like chaperone protein